LNYKETTGLIPVEFHNVVDKKKVSPELIGE
jgi:hypothetical protein